MSGISIGASFGGGAKREESLKPMTSMAMHRVNFPDDIDDETANAMIPHIVGHRGAKITAAGVTSNCTLKLKVAKAGSKSYLSVAGQNVLRANHGARLAQQLIDEALQLVLRKQGLASMAYNQAAAATSRPLPPPSQRPPAPQPRKTLPSVPIVQTPLPKTQPTPTPIHRYNTHDAFLHDGAPSSSDRGKPSAVPPHPSRKPSCKPPPTRVPVAAPATLPPTAAPSQGSIARSKPKATATTAQEPIPPPKKRRRQQEHHVIEIDLDTPATPPRTGHTTNPSPAAQPAQAQVLGDVSDNTPQEVQIVYSKRGRTKVSAPTTTPTPISTPAPASTTKDDDATKPSSDLVRRRPNPPSTPTVTNHVQVTSPPLATPDSLSLHAHAPRSTGPLASDSTPRPLSLVTWTSALQANLGDVATHGSAHTSLKQQFRAAKRRWRLADTRVRHLLAIQSLAAHVALPDTDWAGAATADLRQLHRRMLRERMGADHPRLMVLPEVLQLAVPPPAPQFCNRLIRLQQQLPPHPFECFDALPDMSALSKAKLQRFMQPNADLEESCRLHEELVESAASVADIHEFGVHVVHVTHVLRSIVLHRAAAKEWLYRGYQHAVPAASDGPTAWQDTFHEWRDVVVDAVLPSALPRECHPLVQRTCDWYPYLLPSVLQWTRVMQTRSVETKHEEVPPLHDMVLSLLLSCKMPFPKLIEHHKLLQHHVKAFLVALAKQQVVEWAQLLVEHPDLRDLVVNENESVDEVGHVHLLPGFESPPHQLFDDDIPPCQTLSALAALAHQQARLSKRS
ncbi:hypothetical protein DYB31_006921 [Aphanomyces astaci]|uniref:K Homology domain-containing protein n=1 Tax=Aphanomyces astaci TaxID=112090 RepID=A0A397EG24_APHAT|nr:hypothetical protein DYB31_006921 [Aphanomyces astaci]